MSVPYPDLMAPPALPTYCCLSIMLLMVKICLAYVYGGMFIADTHSCLKR